MDCGLLGFSIHGIFQARILEWVTISFSRDLPDPGIKPGSPALETDALTSEPPGKPKNTGVGCHALLEGICPTQGSNPGLPHCRQILLPTEPPRKPKNTGLCSLSLLQRIFLTQKSNQGLLHCRWILYQLSYQGSPFSFFFF